MKIGKMAPPISYKCACVFVFVYNINNNNNQQKQQQTTMIPLIIVSNKIGPAYSGHF